MNNHTRRRESYRYDARYLEYLACINTVLSKPGKVSFETVKFLYMILLPYMNH